MSSKAAAMPEPKDDNEPSMEEILASIRKIIADDSLGTKKDEAVQKKPVAKKEPEPEIIDDPEPVISDVEMDADVLDLAEVATVASAPEEVAVAPAEEDLPEMVFDPIPVEVAPPTAPPVRDVAALEDRILSENTGSLVSQAFQTLSRQTAMPAVGRSLEDVVVELVRPMLRGWLDDHLPGIVEKLVKAEIERVARGG
jgi:uncharacterized protein